jgi:two-component system sensor kinase FixL
VDPIQIEQVILNLIRNGLDAMETVPVDEREIVIETALEGPNHVTIAVSDRGVGLPNAAAEQLFDPFFTTKGSGLGVGLSISRSIVVAHGGRIWFTINPRRGTTFHFTLPVARGHDHE